MLEYILHVRVKEHSWHTYKSNKHVHKEQTGLDKHQLLLFINSLNTGNTLLNTSFGILSFFSSPTVNVFVFEGILILAVAIYLMFFFFPVTIKHESSVQTKAVWMFETG